MARLNIGGEVRYLDTTPAAGAKVVIRDLDGTDGRENDRILEVTADAAGRFSGRSREWQDREARVLGIDIPDVLRLEFTASVDGRNHSGPFLRLDNSRSAPIILPFPPSKPVTKAERELVQVILVSDADYVGAELALYEFIETASQTLTQSLLGGSYQRLTFVTGQAATLDGLVAALRASTGRSGIEAVDLLFTTHGDTDRIVLADGNLADSTVGEALLRLPEASRRKLRMAFSTACFGRSHLDMWTSVGFNEASGAKGVYADSAVSYAPFLTAWAQEKTFAEAVAAANAADALDVVDGAARAFYTARNEPETAAAIDSTRVRAGSGATRIYSTP